MKITKRQLRKIIREEKQHILQEKLLREGISQLLSEGMTPRQIEEGFGDFLRKGVDFAKAKTGLGMTSKTVKLLQQIKFEKDKYFALRNDFYPNAKDVRNFMEYVEQNARKQAGGSDGMRDLARKAISGEKFKTMMSPTKYLSQARKLSSKIESMMLDGAVDQKGDKTFKAVRAIAESIVKDYERSKDYLKQLRIAVKKAEKSGNAQGLKDVYNAQIEHERYMQKTQAAADKAFDAKAKAAADKERKNKPKEEEDIIRGKSTERFSKATNI